MTQPPAKRYPAAFSSLAGGGHRAFWRRGWVVFCLLAGLSTTRTAQAIQPLAHFLRAAAHDNFALRQSIQAEGESLQQARVATGKLIPVLQLTGGYTRNQYSAAFIGPGGRQLRLAPPNQFDGQASLTVPVVDAVSWAKRKVAWHTARAASKERLRTHLAAAKDVAAQYFGLRGSEGTLEAARHSQEFAERNLAMMRAKQEVGTVSALDVARAESDCAAAVQQVAQAELQVVLARRSLETLSGASAEAAGALAEVALTDEAPLVHWLAKVDGGLPAVEAAAAQEAAATAGDRAARFGYMPTINVVGSERVTNASGLNGGHTFVWNLKANLSWQFDATLTPGQKAQAHAARSAVVRSAQTRRQVADAIFQDYAQIRANQAQSLAARAQVRATKLAETLALEKAAAGILTQLDVTQARRDAFAAEVNRIEADANLLYYRALLRLDSAKDVAELEEFNP